MKILKIQKTQIKLIQICILAGMLSACGIIEDTQESINDKVNEIENSINNTLAEAKRDANGLLEDASLRDSAMSLLKNVLPDSLVVSSVLEGGDSEEGYYTKISRLDSVLSRVSQETDPIKGIQGCMRALPRDLNQLGSPLCYGPSLDYVADSHPDNNGMMGPGSPNMLPGGDLGLWDETTESGQACAAAKLNQLSRNASKYSDLATGSMAMMVCVASFAGDTLPGPGETLDISELLTKLESKAGFQTQGISLTKARVSNIDGDYKIDLRGIYQQKNFQVQAMHSPTNRGGVISVLSGSDQVNNQPMTQPNQPLNKLVSIGPMPNDCMGSTGGSSWRIASLKYQREDGMTSYRMISSAQGSETSAQAALLPSGEVSTNCNTFTGDLNVVQATTGVSGGSMAFGWQAGAGDGFLRVFNATTQNDQGTAWFGYAPHTSEDVESILTIDRMICNWAGVGNSKTGQADLLQMQEMERVNNREWAPTNSKIHYAPTNSCSMDGVAQGDVFPTVTWDITSHDLATQADYTFSFPKF